LRGLKVLKIGHLNHIIEGGLEIQSIYSAVSEDERPEITANNENFEITKNPE
ncbi:8224_t:CDS:2, partial [Gigaspora rosea]